MILIKERDLNKLIRDSVKLEALEDAGVDNWEHYGDAFSDQIKWDVTGFVPEEESDDEYEDYLKWRVKQYKKERGE